MGRKNRQRRAETLRRRQQASTSRDQLSVQEIIHAAAGASREPGGGGRYRELLVRLADGPPSVSTALGAALTKALGRARARHWYHLDISRQAERSLGARHAALVRALTAGPVDLGASVATIDSLACAIEV